MAKFHDYPYILPYSPIGFPIGKSWNFTTFKTKFCKNADRHQKSGSVAFLYSLWTAKIRELAENALRGVLGRNWFGAEQILKSRSGSYIGPIGNPIGKT